MNAGHKAPIIILGAGPTGLGAAYALHKSGFDDWMIYEETESVGGLSRSFVDDQGFTWDLGGHVVFSHYERFTRLLDELLPCEEWLLHERESWIRVSGRWTPYPFQNNIHRLPEEDCRRCLNGLIRASVERSNRPYAHFEDFIRRTLGEGIAEIFMLPYNRKVWAYDPSIMSASWVGDRVSLPDVARVKRNVERKQDDVGWGPNNRFRFPVRGGTGGIWKALAGRLPEKRIVTNARAVELDSGGKTVRFADGRQERYGTLISTIPLDRLANMSSRNDWKELASGLMHSSVHVVGVGIKGSPPPVLRTKCWMYFPENNSPFYRVTHFSHYSPNNVDDIERHWSLMAEISESPEKPVNGAKVVEDTIRGMTESGLIEGPEDVSHTWTHRIEYAYPTPTIGRDRIMCRLLGELAGKDILSRGRFGAWRYEVANMDHSFMQGYEAAEFLTQGVAERTLWDPEGVNAPQGR